MASDPRNIAIDRIGDLATWGTHIALFYETNDDLDYNSKGKSASQLRSSEGSHLAV
jgi:hypothetical protein